MADTWEKLFRQVALKGNLLKASVAATLEAHYTNFNIGELEMSDRGVQFPKSAVDDSLLQAADRVIRLIANDPTSPYRKDLSDSTADIASGGLIPTTSNGGGPIVGRHGVVKDAVNSTVLEPVSRQQVDAYNRLTLAKDAYYYFSDNRSIWHTRPNVSLDVVVWDKAVQRARLAATPRGECPFSEDLHELIVAGALSFLFRSGNNSEQAEQWDRRFQAGLITTFGQV